MRTTYEFDVDGRLRDVGDDAVEEEIVVAAELLLGGGAAGKENCETGQRMVSFLRMCSSAMPFAVAIVRALPSPAFSACLR
jgi:sulfite reductase beta subunit-like hemoprotein